MKGDFEKNIGNQKLIEAYRNAFRIPENLHYYSEEDFRKAERKFIKLGLESGITKVVVPYVA